jgi:hypothetical protein
MQVKPADTSWRELKNLAEKCGFEIYEGGPHTKIKSQNGEFITTIPRHNKIDKDLARGILKRFRLFGCDC